MYIPKHYENADIDSLFAFMTRYSFATIITAKNNYPSASHLPFVIERRNDKLIISSHFSKANLQWQEIEEQQSLVIFTEPHAYISPKFYEKQQNVPTWNYIAVHAYGKGKIMHDEKYKFGMLEKMITSFEKEYLQQWENLPDTFKSNMAKGIVAFEIEVEDIQGKEKLSQNKTEKERNNIIEAFGKSDSENERIVADYMRVNSNR